MNRTAACATRFPTRLFAPLAAAALALAGCAPEPFVVPPPQVAAQAPMQAPVQAPVVAAAPTPPPPRTFTPAQIASFAMPSVVVIRSARALGTGFVVRQDGWIATNLHVIAGAEALMVTVPGRGELPVQDVLAVDDDHDLAVVRVDATGLPPLRLGDLTTVHPGDQMIAIGHPLGFEGTISNGLVSAVRHVNDALTILQITAPIAPGSSGGPLIDEQGRVIGVATAMVARGQNLNFGIPVSYLQKALSDASPVPFAAYAKAVKAVAAALRPPERPIPHHELSTLAGCSEDELRRLRSALELGLATAGPSVGRGDYRLTYHIVEGASIDAEQRLGPACAGPRHALVDARRSAEHLSEPKAQAWAVHDAFSGVLDVIERKLGPKPSLTASAPPRLASKKGGGA